jgi:DNA-directed RNA polymerase specialized sigma24 family protein
VVAKKNIAMVKTHKNDAHHLEVVSIYYQTGDERVLAPLLEQLRQVGLLYMKQFSRRSDDSHWAEDIVDLALMQLVGLLRARQHFTRPPGVMLCVICRRRYADSFAKAGKIATASKPGRDEDPYLLVGAKYATQAEELPINKEDEERAAGLLAAATKAVLALYPNARTAVVLHFFQALSAPEAAAKMGITEAQFTGHLNRGLASLRQWATTTNHPTAEVYAALRRVNTGTLFQDPPQRLSKRARRAARLAAQQAESDFNHSR